MLNTLKAELRKLLTIRTTYVLVGLMLALTVLLGYFGTGGTTYDEGVCAATGEVVLSEDDVFSQNAPEEEWVSPEDRCGGEVVYTTKIINDLSPDKLVGNIQESVSMASLFISIVVVLMVVHEFRFNTITYSLTSSNSRTKFFLAKLITATAFTLIVCLLVAVVSVVTTFVAINAKDLILPAQDYNWLYILARIIGNVFGYSLIGFAMAMILRNLAASIAALFVMPSLDGLGGMLLMSRDIEPTKVLPFSALDRVGNVARDLTGSMWGYQEDLLPATVARASLVVAAYVIGLLIVAWLLFVRRDAN